ncbi:GNAT domain-containing protein, partial [Bisporella sp. PMI_857]
HTSRIAKFSNYAAESQQIWLQAPSLEQHIEDYRSIMTNERANTWSKTKEEFKTYIAKYVPAPERPWSVLYAVALEPDPAPESSTKLESPNQPIVIGVIGTPREAEIGYSIVPAYEGKGHMTAALRLFIPLFWENECNRQNNELLAAVEPSNIGSRRVLEKVDFEQGGLKREFFRKEIEEGRMAADMLFFYSRRPGY